MKYLYFFTGCFIPLPIFYDLVLNKFLSHRILEEVGFFSGFPAPVPIAIFSIPVIGFFSLINHKRPPSSDGNKYSYLFIGFAFSIAFIMLAITSIDLLRIVSLVFSFFIIFFIYTYISSAKIFNYSIKGYLFSVYALVSFHFLSVFYYFSIGIDNSFIIFSSVFGFSVYQSLVSYSAFLSYLACTFLIIAFSEKRKLPKLAYLFFCLIIFFILGFGARKAVLMDVFFLFLAIFIANFNSIFTNLKISKATLLITVFVFSLFAYYFFFTDYSQRAASLSQAAGERSGSYKIFWNTVTTSDITHLFFGHGGVWGGFSNIFVEMIFRLGLLGIAFFLLAFVFLVKFMVHNSIRVFVTYDKLKKYPHCIKAWSIFTILSLIGANSVNMNLQLPYYVLNLSFTSLAFLHWFRVNYNKGI